MSESQIVRNPDYDFVAAIDKQATWVDLTAVGRTADKIPLIRKFPSFSELLRQFLYLNAHGKQLVISMPLNKIRPTHECAMFRRPPEVMPVIEPEEFDRLIEWLPMQNDPLEFLSQI